MANNVQLVHPQGKKAIRMEKEKYEVIKGALLQYLRTSGPATQKDLLVAVSQKIKEEKRSFIGSLPWHLEWVKLDLESKKKIIRVADRSPLAYQIGRK